MAACEQPSWKRQLATIFFAIVAVLVFDLGSAAGGASWDSFGMGLARTMFGFSLGMILSRFNWRQRFGVRTVIALCTALAGLLLLHLPASVRPLYDLAFIAVASPAIVCVGAQVRGTRLDPTLRWLGLISFPLYAIHYPVSDLLRPLSRHFDGGVLAIFLLVALLVASTAIGRIELAFQRWLSELPFRAS